MLFNQKRRPLQTKPTELETLTPTERTILKLIAEYQTSNQIAETLFISPATVKTHRRNICAKLELEGNHSLMKFAVEYQSKL
jgi:DNA-binding CsgD family transcriptional regulator